MLALYCFSVQAKPVIYVVTGKLSKTQRAIIDRVFISKYKSLAKEYPRSEFKVIENASNNDLISLLASSKTLGLIYIGHPAVNIVGEGDDRKIIHGYLQTPSGRYLPKTILSAAHESLKFISILTCHDSAVTPLYTNSLSSSGINYLRSPTHNLDELKNPLLEFTSYYSTPQVLDLLAPKLENYIDQFERENSYQAEVKSTLTIKWRDQVSSHFGYVITVNERIVGVLESAKSSRGRVLNTQRKTFDLLHPLKPGDSITIKADDDNRPRRGQEDKIIDDILIDEVVLTQKGVQRELLDSTIHLGDEEYAPDQTLPLGFLRNSNDYMAAPFARVWKTVMP